ncbi:MAG: alanine racemase [Candidatus Bathyarchaeia archaeon]
MSSVGLEKDGLDTPALLIDLDAMEKNIRTMAQYYRERKWAALLPHQKGHRLPVIAKKQINAGAKGVSMTSLGLAEYYVTSGIDNILITAEIYGQNKIRRLCSLSKQANVTASVDNLENVRQISEEALANNTVVNVAMELYVGRESCGVGFEEAKHFVRELVKYRGVKFKGIWHHGDESNYQKFEDRRRVHLGYLAQIAALRDEIEDAGIEVELLSAGYTCTWNITPTFPSLQNVLVQAGTYVLSDWCTRNHSEGMEVFDCALTVLTRCISRPKADEAMFDFGMNSCSDECGEYYQNLQRPVFKNFPEIQEMTLREEHAYVKMVESSASVRVGDAFEIIPAHSDTTAKLHDKFYGIRNGRVETIWPNYGRGLL